MRAPASSIGQLDLGCLEIDRHTEPALVAELLQHALTGDTTRHVATINAQFYVLADRSQPFRTCIAQAEYRCADGMSIVWACRALAGQAVDRIAGVDLIGSLCDAGAPHALRVFLLGGRPGTAAKTAHRLQSQYPGLQIAGVSCPAWGFEQDDLVLRLVLQQIAAAQPHILFVAFGAPRQELFIDRYIRPLGIPVAIGIGGSFEILSGQTSRAPRWMQTAGLEWAFRLAHDPGRLWRRYLLGNVEFLWCLAKWQGRLFQRKREAFEQG